VSILEGKVVVASCEGRGIGSLHSLFSRAEGANRSLAQRLQGRPAVAPVEKSGALRLSDVRTRISESSGDGSSKLRPLG
jgi:hypothetical protein